MRTAFIWISGLLACGLIGGMVGSFFDTYSWSAYGLSGFLAGMLAFCCLRLWLGERRSLDISN